MGLLIPASQVSTNQYSKMTENEQNKDLASGLYCYCKNASCCSKCGKPMTNKEDTRSAISALIENERPARANVAGNGPLLLSDVPQSVKECNDVMVGIDEAGRGSVLGPMIYGAAYWSCSVVDKIPKGFQDSKALTEQTRNYLFQQLMDHEHIGFCMRSLLPSEISRNMLRPHPYNLNEMSHDSAIVMIRKLLDAGVNIKRAFIDTVGNAFSYKRKLEREFPGIDFTVESKADAKYPPCSAASVGERKCMLNSNLVAKVCRDKFLEAWKFSEDVDVARDFGSGYPSDPKCKQWMAKLQDPLFGYSDFVRFSWAPTKNKFLEDDTAVAVTFKADLDDNDADGLIQQQKGMTSFLSGGKKRKRKGWFERRNIKVVYAL
eukprot:scaffold743_cov117-Cylindrotheca_fusiformis.AAC.18